jgi:uncharacterized double-CXXCG motif protein
MRLFKIEWAFPNNPIIAGNLEWGLPGIDDCPVCHITGGAIKHEYPAIDISPIIKNPKEYTRAWPVPLDKLEELRKPIRRFFPSNVELLPGIEFGPIIGRALAKPGDFAWARLWTPLISEIALRGLESKIGKINAVPAEIKFRGKFNVQYYALHIERRAEVHKSCIIQPGTVCSGCGNRTGMVYTWSVNVDRYDFKKWKENFSKLFTIDKSSVPNDVHIFRDKETGTILVTEAFKNAVAELNLTDIRFDEILVA